MSQPTKKIVSEQLQSIATFLKDGPVRLIMEHCTDLTKGSMYCGDEVAEALGRRVAPEWVRTSTQEYPDDAGWYAVLLPGDSESEDGHTIYDYPDFVTFAQFYPPVQEPPGQETEEPIPTWVSFDGLEGMIAWCGPFNVPPIGTLPVRENKPKKKPMPQ